METLWQDLRYSARMLRQQPGFTSIVVIVLALGIGVNTAIFSIVGAVLLRPLPYSDPERLVVVWMNNTREGNPQYPFAAANFIDLRAQNQSFEDVAAFPTFTPTMILTGRGEPSAVTQAMVFPSLFSLLGAEAAHGRTFLPEEGQIGHDRVALISHGLWQSRFGGDPNLLGQSITLSGQSYTVAGVMPPDFQFPSREIDVWVPLSFDPQIHPSLNVNNRTAAGFGVIGRLKPGVTLDQARADLSAIARRLEEQYPQTNAGFGVTLVPLHEQVTGAIRPVLWALFGAVSFVLLIACANVATLLLARARARDKELAIRAALGASRLRLVRQALTESVLLSLLGGALGLLVAIWGIDLLLALNPSDIPRQQEIGVNTWVLGFAGGISLLTGLVFGLAPALQASQVDLNKTLKEGGRSAAGSASQRLRSFLVVTEIALTVVLLIGAGLLTRSFVRLLDVNPGFETDNLLTMGIAVPSARDMSPAQKIAFYQELFQRVEALPGVAAVGAATRIPLTARGVTTTLDIESRPTAPGERPELEFRRASINYFRAIGIPLLSGRSFTAQDTPETAPVAIINEAAARRFWPGEDPVGRRVRTGPNPNAAWMTIVGVIGNVRHFGLDSEPRPELYISSEQAPPDGPIMVVRTSSSDPLSVAAAVRAQVQALNSAQPVGTMQTMSQILAASVGQRRFNMLLLGIFAGLALLLAVVGLYGVISYSVNQRTQEIGVRLALGAQARDIMKLVLRQGLILSVTGVLIGLAGALALTRVIAGMLYGVTATDPLTFATIALLLIVVTLLASYIPARRATRVDPMVALRYE